MIDYPALNSMTDLELIILHHEVANSRDSTDKEFKKSIELKLKERHLSAIEQKGTKG